MRIPLLMLTLTLAGGCGSDGDDTSDPATGAGGTGATGLCASADTFTAGMARMGDEGRVELTLMSSDPAPPERHDNTWVLKLTDVDGNPAEGATVIPKPNMPQHGHGTNTQAVVTELGAGEYQLDPINLFMPGYWEIPIDVTLSGGETDSISCPELTEGSCFKFCVDS